MLKQRVQRIKPSRQCIDVLARRNAQAVQAAGHALVESLLDLLETTFHLALGFGDAVFHCIDLAVGRVDLLVNQLLAFLLDAFAGLDQVLEVLDAFLACLGVSAQARQPDFPRIGFYVSQRASLVLFSSVFLDGTG